MDRTANMRVQVGYWPYYLINIENGWSSMRKPLLSATMASSPPRRRRSSAV